VDVVDEPADLILARDERTCLDPRDRLPHVLVEIAERLGRPLGLDAGVVLHLAAKVVVREREHSAVGVVDQHDLFRSEQSLRDRERADLVVGDHAAGVADDMRVALVEAEQAVGIQPRVHARDDGNPFRGREW
jgi:hypothetical protein